MTRIALLAILMFCCMVSYGQNISVTFTGTGAATKVDSVTATNLRTNQSITFPGSDTLILDVSSGIPTVSGINVSGMVFPNPFSGKATFKTSIQKSQTVYLKVQNLAGRVVAETQALVQPGENEFSLSMTDAGIYMLSITTDKGTASYKVICSDGNSGETRIQYNGTLSDHYGFSSSSSLKNFQTGTILGYRAGDVIYYRCMSGIYATIITDSPVASKNYEVKFYVCADLAGKSYSVVKIGTQNWMAENLAYLPSVNPYSASSYITPYYFVYAYNGTTVSEAKAAANYTTYGVLYNWPAAMTACPSGWHLPTDAEWKILEKNQGMTNVDADAGGLRTTGTVGGKLKEAGTSHWTSPNTDANNSSGFTALPGGLCLGFGFDDLGLSAYFWSATEDTSMGSTWAFFRGLGYNDDGVYRSFNPRVNGFSVRCLQN